MKKLSLVAASLLVLGTASAFAQTPSPGSPSSSQDGASTGQKTCSASDAARIRNGQQPSTPCTVSPSSSGSSSSMPGGAGSSAGGGTPTPGQ